MLEEDVGEGRRRRRRIAVRFRELPVLVAYSLYNVRSSPRVLIGS
jgi:hypothetical protein